MLTVSDRCVPLQGAKNFRDFGGYEVIGGGRVKRGLLYRAAGLSTLTGADLEVLAQLSIRVVCDLRREAECQRSPSRWCEGSATRFYHLPFFDDQGGTGGVMQLASERGSAEASRQIMIELYRKMVTEPQAIARIRSVFELLSGDSALPLLVHCSGGKDRTGVTCALILSLLGVGRKVIMDDYLLSEVLFTRTTDVTRQSSSQVFDSEKSGGLQAEALLPIYQVAPDYLDSAFRAIDDVHGSLDAFFADTLGLSQDRIKTIRRNLLERG